MLESTRHIFQAIYNVQGLIEWGGTLLVCVIVFVETGFFVGFFLPGDSLLVTAGVFAAAGQLHMGTLLGLVTLCAISGDQIGYWIGRKAGQALYRREDSFFFRRKHLERTHNFYETYGGKTIHVAYMERNFSFVRHFLFLRSWRVEAFAENLPLRGSIGWFQVQLHRPPGSTGPRATLEM